MRDVVNLHTLIFEENTTFRDNNRDISVYEALAFVIGQGNGDVGVFDTDVEGNAKDASGWGS